VRWQLREIEVMLSGISPKLADNTARKVDHLPMVTEIDLTPVGSE
jgi:hypothetical protein